MDCRSGKTKTGKSLTEHSVAEDVKFSLLDSPDITTMFKQNG
jgi:hypothetical protein